MSHHSILDLIHISFSLALFLFLILIRLDTSESREIWCCRGWSDDVGKPGQVETKACEYGGVCRGETSCTDAINKDCATNWECPTSSNGTYPNKTDDDCTKPEVGKECYCDKPWCNCPQSLKTKETPERKENLKCCMGTSKDPPEKLEKQKCGKISMDCIGYVEDDNVTELTCAYTNNERLRADCYSFSYKKYGYGSDHCRCTTDYCNCPPGQKPAGAAGQLSWKGHFTTRFGLALVFWFLVHVSCLDF